MKKTLSFIIMVSVIILSGCQSGGGDPKSVLNHFFDALASKNIDEAKKYVTKDSEGMLGMVQMGMNNMPDSSQSMMYKKENMDMGDAVITGDRATVAVKDKKSGEVTDFVLKKENNEWKVAFDKSTLMEMAQKKMKEHGLNNQIDGSIDSLHEKMKSLSKEDMEHAKKMMDSVKELMNK
ncbi:MAG: DUF4878 domain-containing protein [Ginsengibacter sp.]